MNPSIKNLDTMKNKADEKNKREVTMLELSWVTKEELYNLANSEKFYSFILEESLSAIVDALKNKKDKAELFNIFNMSVIVEVEKIKFKSILKEIEKYFIENEEYERCTELQKLIKKYKL